MTDEPNALETPRTPFSTFAWAAVLSALLGFGAVYVTLRAPDNGNGRSVVDATRGEGKPASGTMGQMQALPAGAGANPLSVGEMAAFVFKKAPEPLPETAFVES